MPENAKSGSKRERPFGLAFPIASAFRGCCIKPVLASIPYPRCPGGPDTSNKYVIRRSCGGTEKLNIKRVCHSRPIPDYVDHHRGCWTSREAGFCIEKRVVFPRAVVSGLLGGIDVPGWSDRVISPACDIELGWSGRSRDSGSKHARLSDSSVHQMTRVEIKVRMLVPSRFIETSKILLAARAAISATRCFI